MARDNHEPLTVSPSQSASMVRMNDKKRKTRSTTSPNDVNNDNNDHQNTQTTGTIPTAGRRTTSPWCAATCFTMKRGRANSLVVKSVFASTQHHVEDETCGSTRGAYIGDELQRQRSTGTRVRAKLSRNARVPICVTIADVGT